VKPCVVAIIKGGLGNQLFAYAAARAFALRSGRELLVDDASGFVRDGYGRSFRLDRFPIEAQPAPSSVRLGDPKGARHKLVRATNRLLPSGWRNYFSEKAGIPAARLLSFRSHRKVVHLNGYWQDEACFLDFADRIRAELEPPPLESEPDRELEQELVEAPSVFLHLRRVRYSPRLGSGYYQSSILRAADAVPGCRFEVFGDELEWGRRELEFGSHPVRFHDGKGAAGDELRDFRLMTACRHAIVANSSFSWWAAWLRAYPGKQVWTPQEPGWPVIPAAGWTPVPNRLEFD